MYNINTEIATNVSGHGVPVYSCTWVSVKISTQEKELTKNKQKKRKQYIGVVFERVLCCPLVAKSHS